jgi:peptide/nickel transport system permease protein
MDYVTAARAIGTKDSSIVFRYVLPNSFTAVLVQFSFGVASGILTESALSFLGLGIRIPEASWGNMLYGAQSITYLSTKPWLWVPPGVILIITVLCVNFIGDGLRDALDPKMKV